MNPIGISAIQEFHEKHQATYVENNGLMLPSKYPFIDDAIIAVEKSVGIHDISSYVKIILNGDNILETLQLNFEFISTSTNQVRFMKSIDYDFTLILGELTKDEYFILVDRLHKTNLMEIIYGIHLKLYKLLFIFIGLLSIVNMYSIIPQENKSY